MSDPLEKDAALEKDVSAGPLVDPLVDSLEKDVAVDPPLKLETKETNPLVYTSLIFATNATTAFMVSEYSYSSLFATLTITSVITHQTGWLYINLLDKMVIGCIFVKGALLLKAKYPTSHPFILVLVVATFMYCVVFYCAGAILKRWCLDPDVNVRIKWHVLMHVLGSCGHHLIALM